MNIRPLLPIVLMTAALCCQAQKADGSSRQQRGREQLIEYRHKFLSKDLDLSAEQQSKFFALYDEMNDRLEAVNDDYRETGRKIDAEGSRLSDVALDACSRRMFEQKKLEGEIELEYYDKFKSILSSKQLARLKQAEMQIIRNLNKFHRGRRVPPPPPEER